MREYKEHEIEWTNEKVSRLWDYYSKTSLYNQMYFTKVVGKDVLKRVEKIIGSLNNKRIVDFGCGPAFFIDHMIELDINPKEYIGLDFSENSIENIKNKPKSKIKKQGIFTQEYPSKVEENSVDVCFLIEVIEHLNDKYLDSTLQEIYRILKLDGYLIITTPNNEDMNLSKNICPECGCIYHKWQHVRKWTNKSLQKNISKYNFTKINIQRLSFISENKLIFVGVRYLYNVLTGKNDKNLFGIFKK